MFIGGIKVVRCGKNSLNPSPQKKLMENTEEFEFQSQAFIFTPVLCCEGSPRTQLCHPLAERVNPNKRGIFAHFKENGAHGAGSPTMRPRDPPARPHPLPGFPAGRL